MSGHSPIKKPTVNFESGKPQGKNSAINLSKEIKDEIKSADLKKLDAKNLAREKKKKKEVSFAGLTDQSKKHKSKKTGFQKFCEFINEGPLKGLARWSGFIAAMLGVDALVFAKDSKRKWFEAGLALAVGAFGLLNDLVFAPILNKLSKPAEKSKIDLDKDIVWEDKEEFLHILKQFLGYKSSVQTNDDTKEVGTQSGNMLILFGPPGTGKTAIAKGIANTVGKPIVHVNISEVLNKYVGASEANLKTFFARAKMGNEILFFDEADALLRSRTSNDVRPHDAMRTNAFIQEFNDSGVKVIAATNSADEIDDAIKSRSLCYNIPAPSAKLRYSILLQKLKSHNLREKDYQILVQKHSKELEKIAEMHNFTGRDIEAAVKKSMHIADKRITDLKDEALLTEDQDRLLVSDIYKAFNDISKDSNAAKHSDLGSSNPFAHFAKEFTKKYKKSA